MPDRNATGTAPDLFPGAETAVLPAEPAAINTATERYLIVVLRPDQIDLIAEAVVRKLREGERA